MISQFSEGLLQESSSADSVSRSYKQSYPELEALLNRKSEFGKELNSRTFPGAHLLLRSYFGKGILNPLTVPRTPAQAYKRFHAVQGNLIGSNWSLESSVDPVAKDYIKNNAPAIYVVTHSNIVADFMSLSTIIREQNPEYTAFPVVGENLREDASFAQFCNAGNVIYVARKGMDKHMLDRMDSILSKKDSGVYIASTPGVSSSGRIDFDKRIGFLLANYSKKGIPVIPVSISYSDFPANEYAVRKNTALYRHGEYIKENGEDKQRIIKGLFPQRVNPLNPFSVRRFLIHKPSLYVSLSKPVTKGRSKREFIDSVSAELIHCYTLHNTQKNALAKLVDANYQGFITSESKDYLDVIHGIGLDGLRADIFNLGAPTTSAPTSSLSLEEVSSLAICATPAYQKWHKIGEKYSF